jgi:hypothetical protein
MKKPGPRVCLGTILMLAAALLVTSCQGAATQPTPAANGPNMTANEMAAVARLRAISSGETTYIVTTGNGNYGTLKQLLDANIISSPFAASEGRGYKFEVRLKGPSTYEAVATPIQYGLTGRISYYIGSSGGEIRGADKKGQEATESDPILN